MGDPYAKLSAWFTAPIDEQMGLSLASIVRDLEPLLCPVWHPLGIKQAKLAHGADGDTFRLHVWSAENRDSHEQAAKVHDHLFNIDSRVVFGSIGDTRYDFTPNPEGTFRVLRVEYRERESALKETLQFGDLNSTSVRIHTAPAEYCVPRFELHETTLSSTRLALTVVHTTDPTTYEPRAIFMRGAAHPPQREPIPCEREIWLSLLRQMIPL